MFLAGCKCDLQYSFTVKTVDCAKYFRSKNKSQSYRDRAVILLQMNAEMKFRCYLPVKSGYDERAEILGLNLSWKREAEWLPSARLPVLYLFFLFLAQFIQ